jgi:hypothetical protein
VVVCLWSGLVAVVAVTVAVSPAANPVAIRRARPGRAGSRRVMAAKGCWPAACSGDFAAEHAGLGPASLVLYDVSTLYFETDAVEVTGAGPWVVEGH